MNVVIGFNKIHSKFPDVAVGNVTESLQSIPERLAFFQAPKTVFVFFETPVEVEGFVSPEDDEPAATIRLQVTVAIRGREWSIVVEIVHTTESGGRIGRVCR